ncbi:hypothetical protein [Mycoplasmopsis bovis]|uniref:hypothetical protein n=1 Tax=Mycoplasmopsis bovis TaxID=28903 RepID=UPI003D29EA4E
MISFKKHFLESSQDLCFLNEMMKIKNVKHISNDQWRILVDKYERYNLGMNIESMSGRSPKNTQAQAG